MNIYKERRIRSNKRLREDKKIIRQITRIPKSPLTNNIHQVKNNKIDFGSMFESLGSLLYLVVILGGAILQIVMILIFLYIGLTILG